jgi:N-acetylglucosaminyldiphosphoundecaprenol N-acetyl-beta-D-mannosaminyltransferase
MKLDILGLAFDNVTMAEAVSLSQEKLQKGEKFYCVTPNAEIGYKAIKDATFRNLVNDAGLLLPDGAGVILASKIIGTPLKEKVAGVDFADNLMTLMEQEGYKLYLLGGKPGVAQMAGEKMLQKHPSLQICGMADGYFQDETAAVAQVNASGADILFVCLGAPKQELFMKHHLDELNVKMMIGLGGTLDAFAGTVKRAPKWMIRCNLEWFYRLVKEPKRLGRMMCLPKYILAAFAKKIRR